MPARPKLLMVVLALQLALGGAFIWMAAADFPFLDGDDGPREALAATRTDRFDSARAYAEARRQLRIGRRPAGSRNLRRLAVRLRDTLPRGRFEGVPRHRGLRNVVGVVPGRRPAVVIGAHYDTYDIPDFVGANDAAAGTAVVLELARVLARTRRPAGSPELRFVLFDGEEMPNGSLATDFERLGLRGSKAYAARHADEIARVIIVDFVGQAGLRLRRDESADEEVWADLRAAAGRVGAGAVFPDETQGAILDDHTPFLRRGIPAVDLIDFDYPCYHEPCDRLDQISRRSLDAVGETLVDLLRR